MSTSKSLTGGTYDVNPQWFTIQLSQSAADTTTTQGFNIPIQRLKTQGRAQVLEILKIYWFYTNPAEVDSQGAFFLTTNNTSAITVVTNSPGLIDFVFYASKITTSGSYLDDRPKIHDLTDGAGHGYLVATDSVYLQIQSNATSVANSCTVRMLYRWKNVSLPEYIGIVQSQA